MTLPPPHGPLLVALAVALSSARAAAGVRLDLVRNAGASACADGAAMQREVVRRLATDAFAGAPERFIEVVLDRADGGPWTARVRVRDADGTLRGARELSSDDATCGPLADAVALTVALLIDPDAPAVTAPVAPPRPAPVCPPPRVVVRRPRDPVASLSLHAVVASGTVPGVGVGASLRTDVVAARGWRVRVGATWLPAAAVNSDGARYAVGLTTARVGVCRQLAGGEAVAVDACVDLTAGALHASVDGASATGTGDFPWVAALAGARLRWRPTTALVVDADASAAVPFVRRSFGAAGVAPAYESAAIGITAGVGVGVVLR